VWLPGERRLFRFLLPPAKNRCHYHCMIKSLETTTQQENF
jgi:hypothetical protein